MKIKKILKRYITYIQLLSIVVLVFAFIPALNPITDYSGQSRGALAFILGSIGNISGFFGSQIPNFQFYSDILFILVIVIYIAMVLLLFGVVLTFGKGDNLVHGKRALFFSSIILTIVYLALGIIYFSINLTMHEYGSDIIFRKLLIILKIPPALIITFFLNLAILVLSVLDSGADFLEICYKIQSAFSHRFKGGVHVPYNKVTASQPIETLPPAKEMVYPLSQHIGAQLESLVKVGDYVTIGQKIADSSAAISAPIHATVSGNVVKIEPRSHPTADKMTAIVVENDFEDREHESLHGGHPDFEKLNSEQIIDIVHNAGITGMGGASFPTHMKLKSSIGKVDTLIINAAECEPYLSNDNRVIIENTSEVIDGIKILKHTLGVNTVLIGIESNKPRAIKAISKAASNAGFKVIVLYAKYPQGGEKQLIKAVCGRVVPSGKLPADVGCCVFNVDTAVSVYRAVVKGRPVMNKIITVAGDGVEHPKNLNVRIGTPFSYVLEYCGLKDETSKVVMGGPMMGISQYSMESPVIKNTSGLICFTKGELTEEKAADCIRCGACVEACPMNLLPNYIGLYTKRKEFDKCKRLGALDCIECGSCSYTCPQKIPLVQYLRLSKQTLSEMSKKEGMAK